MTTAVGYAGGATTSPTYHHIADHAEAVRIEFDPEVLSFDTLLGMFWAGHDPSREMPGSQYRAELFCEDERQLSLAHQSAGELAHVAPVRTKLRVGVPFHPAEAYHQKWRLRRQPELFSELRAKYPSEPALLASVAAAKVNGYVGGYAPRATVERDLELLDLSDAGADFLRSVARHG